MRASNFKLPLSTLATPINEAVDNIVVGGGVAGCLLGGKLLGERSKTVVVERGTNVLTQPAWQYSMPAATLINAFHNPQYVSTSTQRVNSDALRRVMTASQFPSVLVEEESKNDSSSNNNDSNKKTTSIPLRTPNVLGGSQVVLGGRTWFRGIESDWPTATSTTDDSSNNNNNNKENTPASKMPWNFDPRMLQLLRRLEAIPPVPPSRKKGFEAWTALRPTLRGKKGIFRLARPKQSSQVYKPVLESLVNAGCSLTSEWNPDESLSTEVGAGRISDIMVDFIHGSSLTTLGSYLAPHLEIQNAVVQGEVHNLVIDEKTKQVVGVELRSSSSSSDKKENQIIQTNRVVLSAGCISTPTILYNTAKKYNNSSIFSLPDEVGQGFWTVPTVTLRYSMNQPYSHASATSPIVQWLTHEEWRRNQTGWGMSAYDDFACFFYPSGKNAPSLFSSSKSNNNKDNNKKQEDSTSATTTNPYQHEHHINLLRQRQQQQGNFSMSTNTAGNISNYSGDSGVSLFNASHGNVVRVNVQPFMTTTKRGLLDEHGFQLKIQLLTPKSRGNFVSSSQNKNENENVHVDFNVLGNEQDILALEEAVDFVSKAIDKGFDATKLIRGTPHSAEFSLDGPHGGGCVIGSAVDATTLRLNSKNSPENLLICDSSLSPCGQAADASIFVMCAGEHAYDKALKRKLGSLD